MTPKEKRVRKRLRSLKNRFGDDGGTLIVMWSGHGIAAPDNGGLRLMAADSDADEASGLTPADLMGPAVYSGANQVLLIVDTCFSGNALPAAQVAASLFAARPPGGRGAWVGVLSASSRYEQADDGVLAAHLCHLLRHGPVTPELRRRWSPRNRLVRGDDLCDAILKEWPISADQQPQFLSTGNAWEMIRNPLWAADAPAAVVEHLLSAARGARDPVEASWFTGRVEEVNRVVGWVTAGVAGLWVVTGSAGTGKSAIVGRVVSASVPTERRRLLTQNPVFGHQDPGERSVAAHAHARRLTVNRLAQLVDQDLTRDAVLDRDDAGPRNGNELIGAVERVAEVAGNTWHPPVVVVDGLDEAREEAFEIASELLVRLARWCTVIVSTRNLPASTATESDLLGTLAAPDRVLDLDVHQVAARGQVAIRNYVIARLSAVSPVMDPLLIAEHFLANTHPTAGHPFLIAGLMTAQLRAVPIDTGQPGWPGKVSTSLGQSLHSDLTTVTGPAHRSDIPDAAGFARGLLTALTWGLGAGLPEAEWIMVAATVITDIDRNDIAWVLDRLGRYVVEDGENGVAVYRLAHQSVADHLKPPHEPTAQAPFDPQALPVATALIDRYRDFLSAGRPAAEPGYLWKYAWRHAANAGPAGLRLFRELTALAPELHRDVAFATDDISHAYADRGRYLDALPLAEEAAGMYRILVADHHDLAANLASALLTLGRRYGEVGRAMDAVPPTEEGVTLRRRQAAEDPIYLPALGEALNSLGGRYAEVARWDEAVACTEEAVAVNRNAARSDPASRAQVALTLSSLGSRYSEVGRWQEAVAFSEDAVAVLRQLTAANPTAYQWELAMVLSNLGSRYSEVGRWREALGPSEEALSVYRELARENPVFVPHLAGALNSVGIRYDEVGRWDEAIPLTEEAAEMCRALAASNPGFQPDLAAVLNNLGGQHNKVGRWHDAVAPTEEALRLYRALSAENPVHHTDVAMALINLGARYGDVGRVQDSIAATEKAVTAYRQLAVDNPVHRPDLAMALNNMALRYSDNGLPRGAVVWSEEAVAIWREQAAQNPGARPDFAGALTNLGTIYWDVGRLQDAVTVSEEAVAVYRRLAEVNPVYRPELAGALSNLAAGYDQAGRRQDAVAPAEEAVTLLRQHAENQTFARDLAGAVNNLGVIYRGAGRAEQAVAAGEEAVALRRTQLTVSPERSRVLAAALTNLSVAYSQVNRWPQAVATAEEVVAIRLLAGTSNPADRSDLAQALLSLGARLTEAGQRRRFDGIWERAVSGLPGEVRAFLWCRRAAAADAGDLRVVQWITAGLADAGDDRPTLAALHTQARWHRKPDKVRFDNRWAEITGEPAPGWLKLDEDLLASAKAWVDADTAETERNLLADHVELLEPSADAAVDEALLGYEPEDRERYKEMRMAARKDGVRKAYRRLVLYELAREFVGCDAASQRALLADRLKEFRSDRMDRIFDELVWDNAGRDEHQERAVLRARSLVTLARHDRHIAAMDALDRSPADLLELAAGAATDGEPFTLYALAMLAAVTADSAENMAEALLHLAIAAVLANDANIDTAAHWIREARTHPPGNEGEWINYVARIGRRHPAALTLIPHLTVELSEGEAS